MRGLANKVSIVAGASPGGIGAAAASRLAAEGSSVVVADLRESSAARIAEEIQDAGGEAIACGVDISSEQSYAALIATAERHFGGADCLFQVAADLSPATIGVDGASDVTTIPTDVWNRTLDVNVTGYMHGAKAAIPAMLKRGGGSIVNTMSAAAWLAQPTRPAYATSKLAIEALTRHIAAAFGQQGVRCNAVAPGLVLTETAARVASPDERERQLHDLPSPRLGQPEDVAAMVAFLFSDDAEWINGQTIRVDGGRVMR